MNHALTYSLVTYLKAQVSDVSNRVYQMYDGIVLSTKVKPFITVEPLINGNEALSSGRTKYAEVHAFTISVHTLNTGQRARLAETVRTKLRTPAIPFYDTSGVAPVLSALTFIADVGAITPMPSEDITDETNTHKAHIDVEITVYRVNADALNFTQ